MSHGITQLANGDFTMSYRAGSKLPWHTLGQPYDGPENAVEFGRKGHTLFPTAVVGLKLDCPDYPECDGKAVDEQYIIRTDTMAPLAKVGPEYQEVQNEEFYGKYVQPWIDNGLAVVDTTASLFGGLKTFMGLKVKGDPTKILGNDVVDLHMLFMVPHDGLSALHMGFTPIRVECHNRLMAAISDSASKLIRIRHRGDMDFKLEKAQELLQLAHQDQEKNAEMWRFLASKPIMEESLLTYVKTLWNIDLTKPWGDVATRTKNMIDEVLNAIHQAPGQNTPEIRGSYMWAWQGINYYYNHVDGRTAQTRMNNLLFGTTRAKDQRAFDLALTMANAA